MDFSGYIRSKLLQLRHKIVSEKASPEFIARGWAIGMFYGCCAPIGTQLILSIPTAWLMKGSKIGSIFGTFLTNHFTVFFIYPVQCWAGAHLLNKDLSYNLIKTALRDVVAQRSLESVVDLGQDILESFLLGGFLMAVVLTPITYVFVKKLVVRYRSELERIKKKRGAV